MRTLSRSLALVFALIATPALADYGSKPSQPAPTRGSGELPTATHASQTPRQQAEWYYRDAYEGGVKGSKDLANGNGKAAQKRFRRALERSREAVGLDSTYAEGWERGG